MPDLGNPLPRRENTLKRTGIVCIRQRYDSRYPYPVLSRRQRSDYPLNYAFNTAGEITQGILAGKVNRAVLGEPFLSIALRKDSSLRITADLNHLTDSDTLGFAQTAVVYTPTMEKYRIAFEDALRASCQKAVRYPKETIHSLEEHGIFAQGALTPESIERCKIHYLSAIERKRRHGFLRLIEQYEPSRRRELPDAGFIPEKQ